MPSVRAMLLAVLVVCCTVCLAACGDDGPGSTSTGGTTAQAERAPAPVRAEAKAQSEEEERAEQVATDFYEILGEDEAGSDPDRTTIDAAGFCELMSERARAQTVHYAEVSSGKAQQLDCESAVALLALRAKRAGGGELERAEVIGVNAEGDRATASVSFGEGAVTSIPLVKENGKWKLAATPTSNTEP